MRPCTPTRSEPPPRDGSTDLAEGPSVPEGKAKSVLAPIRRLPYSNFARMCKVATKSGLFSWTVHGPFSFPQDGKENGGCILHGPCPLREQESPWPPFGGPTTPTVGCIQQTPRPMGRPPSTNDR